jgi:hypothetical protein
MFLDINDRYYESLDRKECHKLVKEKGGYINTNIETLLSLCEKSIKKKK